MTTRAHGEERDLARDVLPIAAATFVAWWTTVRPAGFGPAASIPAKIAAVTSLLGAALGAFAVAKRAQGIVTLLLGAFVTPAAAAWVLGAEGATALADPIEIFVGAVAWAIVGVLLIRPQAVAVPEGAEGGAGPTIGAADDAARVAMKELDAAVGTDPPPKLVPRHPLPRLSALPLYVAVLLAAGAAIPIVRVSSSSPDRAVLARIVAAAIAIALLSTGGDLVEVRYLARRPAAPKRRLQRAAIVLGFAAIALVLGLAIFSRDS